MRAAGSVSKRFSSFREIPGPKYTRFNFNYGPYAYHIDYKGPSGLSEKVNAKPEKLSQLKENGEIWHKHKKAKELSDIVNVFTNYDEASYQKTKAMVSESVHSSSTAKISPEIKIEAEGSDRFLWSEYGEKLHPAFGSWFSRTLLYILQGVEGNLDLAQEKMFFRDVQEPFNVTKYRVPGGHLMSPSQYKESLLNFYEDVVKRSEMPPICIAREEIATPIPHEDDLYYHLDGSNLVMMDVSESYSHKNRPIYVREKKTGKLRYAEWPERSRRLQAQYPTKHRSMNIPPSVDPDHCDNSEIIDNFLREHDWKGAVQLLETALATFDENDDHYCRLREKLNAKLAEEKCFDHLYATRHGGQFILYLLQNGFGEEYIEHLIENRRGALCAQELRAFIILMEKQKSGSFEVSDKSEVESSFDRIFTNKHFSSPLLASFDSKFKGALEESLTYENRYLLNEYPDYRKHLLV